MNTQDDNSQTNNQGQGAPVPPPQGGGFPPVPPPTGGAPVPPPQGGGYPPAPYPPQGGGYPPAPYPPQGGGYPPAPYPPQGGGYPPAPYPPQGGGYPPVADPYAAQAGGYAPPPQQPEDTTPANFQLGTKFPPQLKIKVPASELKFDEDYFIRLLAGSISLSKDEKQKIVESVPKLKQAQIDELIRIFEEEKQKFAALSAKHVPQLEKLAQQHYDEWMSLEDDMAQNNKKEEDNSQADEIRKNLGL